MNPKVSVIIPSYNCGEFLLDAVNSALEQSYRNIEVVIVDDSSVEKRTLQIIEKLKSYPKVKVYRFENNRGVAASRNFAVKQAQGKYIMPLDCDDKLHKEYIEKAVNILENNQHIKIVYCDVVIFGDKQGVWQLKDFNLKTFLIKNYIHNSALFRREDFFKTTAYDEKLEGLEDWDFWISILEATRGIAYRIPEKLFYYRRVSNSRQEKINSNPELHSQLIRTIVYKHLKFYSEVLGSPRDLYIENKKLQDKIKRIENSFRYKFINFIFKPYDFLKRIKRL